MVSLAAQVSNAERMMTQAVAAARGIRVTFADGLHGLVPFSRISGIKGRSDLFALELPNPYLLLLRAKHGPAVELPWDFVRHYCDVDYRPRMETLGGLGRKALGQRIKALRETEGKTQEELASLSGIGRVTLVRIERGEQSPRFETLIALARGLGRSVEELVGGTC
jgi:DNA-binding XRE family transcriptional regulator